MQVPILGIACLERGYPSPLRSTGMLKLGANLKIISGAQSVTGKIFKRKELGASLRFGRVRLTRVDGFRRGLWMSRSDVTGRNRSRDANRRALLDGTAESGCPYMACGAGYAFWLSRFRARCNVWSSAALVLSYSCWLIRPCLCSTSSSKSSSFKPSSSMELRVAGAAGGAAAACTAGRTGRLSRAAATGAGS
jgi:hypothetical protein